MCINHKNTLLSNLITSDIPKELSSLRLKNQTESTNRGRGCLYHELISEAAFQFGIRFTYK